MNREIRDKWLEDLRSDEFDQGQFHLRDVDDGYCCLGVLAYQYLKVHKLKWELELDERYYVAMGLSGVLSNEIQEWAGLRDGDPMLKLNLGVQCCSGLNDSGVSFSDIADLIEAQF